MAMETSAKVVVKTPFLAYLKSSIKGTLISMVFTTAAILLFALIIQETRMSSVGGFGDLPDPAHRRHHARVVLCDPGLYGEGGGCLAA